jgi:hypothetical protein
LPELISQVQKIDVSADIATGLAAANRSSSLLPGRR